MMICEFCLEYGEDGKCSIGLRLPKRMGCREFAPGLEGFCSNPNDFVSASQIIQMASFFGIKGIELKKVKLMAVQAEETQLKLSAIQTDAVTVNGS
jgi:hypothetical protein